MKVVWFRNDLRIADNPALFHACQEAGDEGVVAVAIFTPLQWQHHDDSPQKVYFWRDNLKALRQQLAILNIPLVVLSADDYASVPTVLCSLLDTIDCTALFLNREYCLNENDRDEAVVKHLHQRNINVFGFHGDVVIPPGDVLNGQGLPYRVFTPFSKAWRTLYQQRVPTVLPPPEPQSVHPKRTSMDSFLKQTETLFDQFSYQLNTSILDLPVLDTPIIAGTPSQDGYYHQSWWPVGEDAAYQRLHDFAANRLADYGDARDFPQSAGTSTLSPYLTCGVLSVRQCLAVARMQSEGEDWLSSQWVTELIWREFYRHLMMHFPEMNWWKPFRPDVEARIIWQNNDHLFEAWCRGETGFPIVDAAMKQLLSTGWMHNRLRMVTASFLTKLLLEDWRKGARFFMQHLIDGDFASNVGGWQWSASVGADAAPYFRIFNPQLQAERFDAEGEFVAAWLPELATLSGKKRHSPELAAQQGRPEPIIDYAAAREYSLASYNNA